MKLLVVGSAEFDAGKTTFTTGLIERTGVRGYKPRAGNGYWYDQDDYRRAVEEGRLYGKDAKQIAAASPGSVRPEEINPVHRLWMPAPGRGKGVLGKEGRRFLLDRVTRDGETYVVNERIEIPPAARRAFPIESAPTVETIEALNELMAEHHAPALSALAEEIDAREAAIVESYANIARPLSDGSPDGVAVVEPRRCRIYDGDRYVKACEVASSSAYEGRLEERVEHVIGLLDPIAEVTLPALSSDERDETAVVADAYETAYDELLATV